METIVEKWVYYFKHAQETRKADLAKIIGSDLVIQRAYEALDQFGWTEAELQSYEESSDAFGTIRP